MLYKVSACSLWGFSTLQSLQDFLIGVLAALGTSVVHFPSNLKHLFKTFFFEVLSCVDQAGKLFEFGKIPFLFCGQKTEPLKEGDHILPDGMEVIHFVVPYAVRALSERATFQMLFEECQDDFITLGNVKAK
jgi:hypothetical protein